MSNLLVIDSDEKERKRIINFFHGSGYSIAAVGTELAAMDRQEAIVYDVLVADTESLDSPPAEFVEDVLALNRESKVIISHTADKVGDGIAGINAGAFDSIQKPYKLAELYVKVERAIQVKRLELEAQSLRGERNLIYRTGDFVGESPKIKDVLLTVQKVTRSDASILLLGESGTGKELIAGAIHYNSHRAGEPFVRVNCAALPEELLESELFGHEKGAFTGAEAQRIGRFEQADGGSIFLDEVGDMSGRTQAKVLRVLQEKQFERVGGSRTLSVDVRVISATNKDLKGEIEAGNFREDLYYRLNVVAIQLPPLREREEDILPLVYFFLTKYSSDLKKHVTNVSEEAKEALLAYHWPGNIRELQNCVERAILLAETETLQAEDFGIPLTRQARPTGQGEGGRLVNLPAGGASLESVEKEAILQALALTDWNQKEAASLLDISRRALNYKIQQHGITHEKWKRNV
jgi:DNA-binding NtrC family response regulator